MAKKNKKEDFRLLKQARKLCRDLTEIQGYADRNYRGNICEELRQYGQTVMYSIWKANTLPAGSGERLDLQIQASEYLEKIPVLMGVVGGLVNAGLNREAQLQLSVENLQKPLINWIKSDLKVAEAYYEKEIKNQYYVTVKAKDTVTKMQKFAKLFDPISREFTGLRNDDAVQAGCSVTYEKVQTAYNEALSTYRIEMDRYKKLIAEYDRIRLRYLHIKDKNEILNPTLGEVLNSAEFKKFCL
jgi:hypothetical protein